MHQCARVFEMKIESGTRRVHFHPIKISYESTYLEEIRKSKFSTIIKCGHRHLAGLRGRWYTVNEARGKSRGMRSKQDGL